MNEFQRLLEEAIEMMQNAKEYANRNYNGAYADKIDEIIEDIMIVQSSDYER